MVLCYCPKENFLVFFVPQCVSIYDSIYPVCGRYESVVRQ